MMARILELEHGVYLVDGTIVWAMDDGMFDGVDRDAELCRLASSANSRFSARPYGRLTVRGFALNKDPHWPAARYAAVGMKHASDLSSGAKEILRKEMPDDAGSI